MILKFNSKYYSDKNQTSEMLKVREQIKHLQNMLSGMVITDEKGLNEKQVILLPSNFDSWNLHQK